MRWNAWAGLLVTAALTACGNDPEGPARPQATVTSASGAANLAAKVEAFRTALGTLNGGTDGQQSSGRREINWDGAVANPFNNRDDFPGDFFNSNVKAGATFTTAGTGFRNDSTLFSDVNPAYARQFAFFSANKIFSPVGSNQLDQVFRVAGHPTPATVRGFGVVFSDVDVAEKTTVQLFASDGSSLGTFAAPIRGDAAGLSFISVLFDEPIIARARITLGTGALGAGVNDISAGGSTDVVVIDNVIYGEPTSAF